MKTLKALTAFLALGVMLAGASAIAADDAAKGEGAAPLAAGSKKSNANEQTGPQAATDRPGEWKDEVMGDQSEEIQQRDMEQAGESWQEKDAY